MRAGEVDIRHELLSLLGEWALLINILNIWCHHPVESDLFNFNNWIRSRTTSSPFSLTVGPVVGFNQALRVVIW
jgi:hypothetical protein